MNCVYLQFITASLLKDLQDFDPLNLEQQPHKRLDLVKQIAEGDITISIIASPLFCQW